MMRGGGVGVWGGAEFIRSEDIAQLQLSLDCHYPPQLGNHVTKDVIISCAKTCSQYS